MHISMSISQCKLREMSRVTYISIHGSTLNVDKFVMVAGVGGLQWKHHLRDKVVVTLNELDPAAISEIKDNCQRNQLSWTVCDAAKDTSPPGVSLDTQAVDANHSENGEMTSSENTEKAKQNGVYLTKGSANIIMHLQQFSFM